MTPKPKRIRSAEWHAKHRERQREYRQDNKDKVKKLFKNWRKRNKDEIKAYHRTWRDKNRGHVRAQNNKDRIRYKARNLTIVNELKKAPCIDCQGIFDAVCMDFDHKPDSKKIHNISRIVNLGLSVEFLMAEIAKCELVCSNCHRIRTKDRG